MVTAKKRIDNIKRLHEQSLSSFPKDHFSFRPKIEYQIKKMIEDGFIKFGCTGDNREQKRYKESEVGIPVTDGTLNIGDYQFTAFIETGENYMISIAPLGLVIERKTCEDLYGTLMSSGNRKRFYKEIKRYQEDPKLNQFLIFAECSKAEFLTWVIPAKRRNMQAEIRKTINARRTTISSLENKVNVCWQGSRKESTLSVRPAVEQWICKNYEKVFEL